VRPTGTGKVVWAQIANPYEDAAVSGDGERAAEPAVEAYGEPDLPEDDEERRQAEAVARAEAEAEAILAR